MSATEALRTQLDALQVEHNSVLAENRKLRDARPEQAREVDLECELEETREQNVNLSREIAQLEATRDEVEGRVAELQESARALTREAAELRERLAGAQTEVEEARGKVARVEGYCRELENEHGRSQAEQELESFRAVARETRKWEERETRLVKRVEELEQGAAVRPVSTGAKGRGGDSEWRDSDGRGPGKTRDGETPGETTEGTAAPGGDPGSPITATADRRESEGGEQLSVYCPVAACSADTAPDSHTSSPHGVGSHHPPSPHSALSSHSTSHVVLSHMAPSHSVPHSVRWHMPPSTMEGYHPPTPGSTEQACLRPGAPGCLSPTDTIPLTRPAGSLTSTQVHAPGGPGGGGVAVEPVPTLAATPFDALSVALLAQQLPSLPSFSGEPQDGDGENFSEWLERLELVANTCRWDDRAKLVNVATRLRGPAARFYRSCTPRQRSNYRDATEALRKRFTPVQIQSVQSSKFHERKQGPTESVDNYAQELQGLFHRAYASTQHEGGGAEAMGKSVLRSQFVAGLRAELRAKVVGCPGDFEELLGKARFEEARLREVGPMWNRPRESLLGGERQQGPAASQLGAPTWNGPRENRLGTEGQRGPAIPQPGPRFKTSAKACFNCGMEGHLARACPYPKRTRRDDETRRPQQADLSRNIMSTLVPEESKGQQEVEELWQRLREAQTKAIARGNRRARKEASTRRTKRESGLGPAVYTEIKVNGVPTTALVDTGSPATIISLDHALEVLMAVQRPQLTPCQQKEEVAHKFSLPEVALSAYGGHRLDILCQVCLMLTQGDKIVEGVVLVQQGAPNDLLLGTDFQPQLGIALVLETPGKVVDLLTGEECNCQDGSPVPSEDSLAEGSPVTADQPRMELEALDTTGAERRKSTEQQKAELTPVNLDSATVATRELGQKDGNPPPRPMSSAGGGKSPSIENPSQEGNPLPRPMTSAGGGSSLSIGKPSQEDNPSPVATAARDQLSLESADSPDGGKFSPTTGCSTPGVVQLLTATRVPARHRKVIRTRIRGGEMESALLLFTPDLNGNGLSLMEAVIESRNGPGVTLLIENHSSTPVHLQAGTILGAVSPCEEVGSPDSPRVDARKKEDGEDAQGEGGAVCQVDLEPDEEVGMPASPRVGARKKEDGGDAHGKGGAVCRLHLEPDDGRNRLLLQQLDLKLEHLTTSERDQLEASILTWADVFALDSSELGTTSLAEHVIKTGDHPPTRQPVRRMPFALRDKVNSLVEEMLSQGVIVPSASPWASPVVLVRKKDGGIRFCVDYRKLNSVTKLDEFPLPRIDDTLDLLAGARYFTTLDLASGYWQVPMELSSQEKTAFSTHSGLYEFKKMPFGLVNAPATFQRLMEVALTGLARGGCHVYLDDVLVFGKSLEEHNRNLNQVLERIRAAGLRLKPKKCRIAQLTVEYLGHVVSAQGVQTDPKKLQAMAQYPTPTDVKSLRSFLGLTSYYRRFVPAFSRVASPLYALTKKDVSFIWGPECQQAFERLKELLRTPPVLRFPDFTCPFILETDASGTGLGAVLAQEQPDGAVHPIAYASRSLQKHEQNYGITELEALGVVWAVKNFRAYLYAHKCTVFTDHEALKSLLNTPQPSGKLARWGMALQELDLTIVHRAGKHNANADALSRCPLPTSTDENPTAEVVAVIVEDGEKTTSDAPSNDLAVQQGRDTELSPIIDYVTMGALPKDENLAKRIALTRAQYTVLDGVLHRVEADSTLRVIPPQRCREKLFAEVHGGRFGAHLSDVKVYSELRRCYWWNGMRRDVTTWTRACLTCATHQPGRKVKPPLTPIPVAGAFDRVGVDVLQLPRTQRGNRYAVVFVDYLTKWPEVFAVSDQTSATIAKLLVEEVISRHGVPSEILSDRGRAFLSGLMKEVEALMGYRKLNTTAYHPQTDGLVERYNRTLTAMLAKTVTKGGAEWDQQLPYVLFAYRASQQASTLESPFYLLYGRDPRLPVPDALSSQQTRMTMDLREYGVELHTKMSTAWGLARTCIGKAQRRQKANYDKKSTKMPFRPGERVFLYKPAEKAGEARKLARPFHGPYRLSEMDVNTATLTRVDKPQEEPLVVAIDRLRRCPDEIGTEFWPPDKRVSRKKGKGRSTHQMPCEQAAAPTTTFRGVSETEGTTRGNGASLAAGQLTVGSPIGGDCNREVILEEQPETAVPAAKQVFPPSVGDRRHSATYRRSPSQNPAEAQTEQRASQDKSGPGRLGKWAGRLRKRGGASQPTSPTLGGCPSTPRNQYQVSEVPEQPPDGAVVDDLPQQGEM